MNRESIFEVVKANVLKVLVDVKPEEIGIDKSLTELGADSIARVEVVIYSMEDLGLDVPRREFAGVRDLAALVDVLQRHADRVISGRGADPEPSRDAQPPFERRR